MLDQCQGFIDIGHAYMLMYHSAAFLDFSAQMAYIVCAFLQDGVIQRVMREPSKRSAERKAFLMRQEGYRARVQKEDCTVKTNHLVGLIRGWFGSLAPCIWRHAPL